MADDIRPNQGTTLDDNEKVLMRWTSVERPFKQHSKEFYSTVLVLAILIGIIFFFIEGFMPVLVVAAITFVVFVLYKTEPGQMEHVITDKGVVSGNSRLYWEQLTTYWFSEKWGRTILSMISSDPNPAYIAMVLPEDTTEESKKTWRSFLSKYLRYQEPEKTWSDRMIDWVAKKVPLEE